MKNKISNIGKRALLTMLVILLMVMVSFGSNFFVQDAKGEIAEGTIWDGDSSPGWYMGGTWLCTVGMKFEVTQPVIVDRLGAYRKNYPYQYYNIRLWTADGNLLCEVTNPSISQNSWGWFSITPIDLAAGTYVISVGIRGFYQSGDYNPGATADGLIEPLNWCRLANDYNGFPGQDITQPIIPYIDIHYTYDVEETIDDLIDDVDGHPSIPQGRENALINKLDEAKTILTDNNPHNDHVACNKLNDFIDQVNGMVPRWLTQAEADFLIQAAEDIKASIGCS